MKTVNVHEALEYLPQLWSDMIVFEHTSRERLLMIVLSAMTKHQPSEKTQQLTQRLATIAWDIWTRVKEQEENRHRKVVAPLFANISVFIIALNGCMIFCHDTI